jgi:hypothetical protein
MLLPLSLFFSTGCTSVSIVPAVETEPPTEDDIAGVTTLAGLGFEFDSAGMIRGDTVYATVEKRPMAIAVDSVQRWWLRRTDPAKSVLAVIGVAAGVVLAAAVIAAAERGNGNGAQSGRDLSGGRRMTGLSIPTRCRSVTLR